MGRTTLRSGHAWSRHRSPMAGHVIFSASTPATSLTAPTPTRRSRASRASGCLPRPTSSRASGRASVTTTAPACTSAIPVCGAFWTRVLIDQHSSGGHRLRAAITQADTCTGGADCVGACCQAKLPATCAVQFQADPALQCTAGEESSATTMCVAGYNCTVDACCVPSPCRCVMRCFPVA
jgi:hypothetical protein